MYKKVRFDFNVFAIALKERNILLIGFIFPTAIPSLAKNSEIYVYPVLQVLYSTCPWGLVSSPSVCVRVCVSVCVCQQNCRWWERKSLFDEIYLFLCLNSSEKRVEGQAMQNCWPYTHFILAGNWYSRTKPINARTSLINNFWGRGPWLLEGWYFWGTILANNVEIIAMELQCTKSLSSFLCW